MPAPRGPVVAAVDASRVAGTWRGRMSCGEWTGPGQTANPNPWSQPVTLVVDGSNAVMTRGGAQTDYDERVSGPIAGDFSTTMQGQGAMHSSPGAPWFTQASGRFEGEGSAQRFTGTASLRNVHGNVMRSCTLSLARVPAP